jgi:hypothetical protein
MLNPDGARPRQFTNVRARHLRLAPSWRVPRTKSARATAFNLACLTLYSGGAKTEPSGFLAMLSALFCARVTPNAIRHWRAGRRHPPEWAICTLQIELRSRARALNAAAHELELEKGKLGKSD